jgi:predicted nucleotidyltransferase
MIGLNKEKNSDAPSNILKEVMGKDDDILFAYHYGSLVFDSTHVGSDIGVAVYLKPLDIKGYIKKEGELLGTLITKFHNDKIDLRILNTSPLLLQYNVIKQGIPIVIRDEVERVDFETQVMNRFFELKPYLDEYERMLSLRIKTGT